MRHVTTLLFLRRNNEILLAMKKRGFGAGKFNGVGGKAEPGENILQAAIRECQEEIGVTPSNAMRVGEVQFLMPDDPEFEHYCHIFSATEWHGKPGETEEMRPEWFALDTIPFDQMWPDDIVWLPAVITGKLVRGTITANEKELIHHKLQIFEAPQEVLHATTPPK